MLSVVEERQKAIIGRLPAFARMTLALAVIGFLATLVLTGLVSGQWPQPFSDFDWTKFSLGAALAILLTVFSNLVVWLFVVWSLAFVPFLAINAHRASRLSPTIQVRTKPIRWVQLYAATFLPMAVFATAWNSLPSFGSYTVSVLRINNASELGVLLGCSALVVAVLYLSNRLIPLRFATVRLSLLSSLLYTTLFLAYGWGVSIASHAMVFGIMTYLMFRTHDFADLARRLAIHDVPSEIADKLEELLQREHNLAGLREELALKKKEHEHELGRQLATITDKKLALTSKVNEKQLEVLGHKIDNLGEAFAVLAGEYKDRVVDELPARLAAFRATVKQLPPAQIQAQLRLILAEINQSIDGIPESLAELRSQLLLATRDLEDQTRLLLSEGNGSRTEKTSDEQTEVNKQS
jgi:hypothetical protein